MAAVTAVVTGAAAAVGAGASAIGTYQSWMESQAQQEDVQKVKKLRTQQSKDILEQIGSEELIYKDELDMIQKQSLSATKKLNLETSQKMEGLGEQVGQVVGGLTAGSKYSGGASERAMSELESNYDETMGDLKAAYDTSMDDLALRDEQSERDAFLRHEEIVGSLEAQREELLAML